MTELAERADHLPLPGEQWRASAGGALASILRGYGALLSARPAECLELLAPATAFGTDAPDAPLGSVSPTLRALRGAALVDLGRAEDGLDELRRARGEAADRAGMAATAALVGLLETRAAVVVGHQELSRAVLDWAEPLLGGSGDLALMRGQRLTAMGRYAAAGDAIRPLLDGSASAHVSWALIDACVLDSRLAVLGNRRAHARRSLDRALASASTMGVLRPLATGPGEVLDLLTRDLGSFGPLEATARRVLAARHALGSGPAPAALTDRERAVLGRLPTQRSLDEIADDLTVSYSTVKTHVRAIYGKLGVNSRREAVDRARRTGLLSPGE
jgi:LuxR family maltose regulon positive regulatory protein